MKAKKSGAQQSNTILLQHNTSYGQHFLFRDRDCETYPDICQGTTIEIPFVQFTNNST